MMSDNTQPPADRSVWAIAADSALTRVHLGLIERHMARQAEAFARIDAILARVARKMETA